MWKNKSSFGVHRAFQLLKFSVFCSNFVLNKTQNNMKINFTFSKIVCALALLAMVFSSCGRSSYNSKLVQVDSLLNATQYEQADSLLKQCAPSNYSTQDRAYHALLRTQCDYKNYIVATTDSAINFAVDYFEKSDDKEKYTRSLIYQGCANEERGNLEKAGECYHKADDIADKEDLYNKAFAKMRLGLLYQNQVIGAKTIAVEKLKEALPLFQKLNEKYYELACVTEIGRIYSNYINKSMRDSSLFYADLGIKLARMESNEQMLFKNIYTKAMLYAEKDHDYKKAKELLIKAKNNYQASEITGTYCYLALCYGKLGNLDSAEYYLSHSPLMKEDVDSIIYYDTASELEKIKGNDALSREYYDKSNTMADSVLIAGLNDRLRAVEKKYDTQQAELENAKLSLELRNTLLTLAAIVIGALALLLLVLRYRHRLREKESEYELLKADLDTSLSSLENMKSTVAQLENGHDNSNNTELKNILEEQIGAVHQLMKWSYELSSDAFVKKFNSLMTMPSGKEQESFWNNLHTITNELHDNVLTRAQEAAGGTLRDDELNYLALYCCGFSRSVIMTCMHYKSLGTVSNKKIQIAQKLNVPNLDHFVHN